MEPVRCTWLDSSDLALLAMMEEDYQSDPLTYDDLHRLVFQTYRSGGVGAYLNQELIGYILFRTEKRFCRLISWFVLPQYRRSHVGMHLGAWLFQSPALRRWNSFVVETRDSNLGGHLFLHRLGFRAIKVQRESYDHPSGDGYLFVWNRPIKRSPCLEGVKHPAVI